MKVYLSLVFLLFTLFSNAVNPVKEYVDHPGNYDFSYQEIELKTEDGFTLKSWVCQPHASNANNTVLVLAYGDSGNMSFYLRQVHELVKQGFTVLMFDYRGFGSSDAFHLEEFQLYYDEFVVDLNTALSYAKTSFKGSRLGLWTLSTGSIMGVLSDKPSLFSFMISEGFVSDPLEVVSKIKSFKSQDYMLPESSKEFSQSLSTLTLPLLLIAGDKDGLATVEESSRLRFLNPKNDLVVFKGGHLQGFQALSGDYHGQKYIESIALFLEKL